MKSNYKLGDLIQNVDVKNKDLHCTNLRGLSMNKEFRASTSNIVGTDLSKYKIVSRKQFACDFMSAIRVHKMPIAFNTENEEILVSPAYAVFEVKDENIILPEYLMLWFTRPEFDRYADFRSDAAIRGGYGWNELCDTYINLPSLDEQRATVRKYQAIANRIALKKQINDNLVATLSAVYKELFSDADTRFPKVPLQKICSKIGSGATPKGGKAAYFSEGISLIRSTNVFDYSFEYEELAHINQSQADALANVIVEPNDVLFNITGVSVARCCMVPSDVLPARVNQHVMIVRPSMGEFMSYYIMFTLCSAENKAKLLGIGQSGSTREAINKQELESFEIPLPDDALVQNFGAAAKKMYNHIQTNVKEIHALDGMKKVLLAQLSSR